MIAQALRCLAERRHLPYEIAQAAMLDLMSGRCTDSQIGAFLMGLRAKGETVEELTAMAQTMRALCVPVRPRVHQRLLDLCGTGGAPVKTFNVSTVSAFVVAGAGVPVAKHGNRRVTSSCGSADLLEALGVTLAASAAAVERAIEQIGIGFLFAPHFHPAMRYVARARQELAMRTVFNMLGPLSNPARVRAQLVGVYGAELVEVFAKVLSNLGVEHALVVYGLDGVDEIAITGPTLAAEVRAGQIRSYEIDPRAFGFKRASSQEIAGLPPAESASVTRLLLENKLKDARYEMVLLNAGAAIYLGGGAASLEEGLQKAEESIVSGKAWEKLTHLIAFSREEAVPIGPP